MLLPRSSCAASDWDFAGGLRGFFRTGASSGCLQETFMGCLTKLDRPVYYECIDSHLRRDSPMNAIAELIDARPRQLLQPRHTHMELHQPETSNTSTNTALSYGLFWWACVDDRSIIKRCTRNASKVSNAFLSLMTVLYGLTQTPHTALPLAEIVTPDRTLIRHQQARFLG